MADYLIINGTGSVLTNVNVGGDDVAAYGFGDDGVGSVTTLTSTELAALLALDGVAVLSDSCTQEQRRMLSKVLRLGKNPGA